MSARKQGNWPRPKPRSLGLHSTSHTGNRVQCPTGCEVSASTPRARALFTNFAHINTSYSTVLKNLGLRGFIIFLAARDDHSPAVFDLRFASCWRCKSFAAHTCIQLTGKIHISRPRPRPRPLGLDHNLACDIQLIRIIDSSLETCRSQCRTRPRAPHRRRPLDLDPDLQTSRPPDPVLALDLDVDGNSTSTGNIPTPVLILDLDSTFESPTKNKTPNR